MHEYHKIKNRIVALLSPLGFEEDKPDTETDYCGSIHSIYANADNRFMILWDGEEGFGSVESWKNEKWTMLNNIVPESTEEEFDNNLAALITEIKSQI